MRTHINEKNPHISVESAQFAVNSFSLFCSTVTSLAKNLAICPLQRTKNGLPTRRELSAPAGSVADGWRQLSRVMSPKVMTRTKVGQLDSHAGPKPTATGDRKGRPY